MNAGDWRGVAVLMGVCALVSVFALWMLEVSR